MEMSPDFLQLEKFPTLSFKSATNATGEGLLGQYRIAISATTRINRKDFALTWNAALETDGIVVGDEVTIALDAKFVKA